MVIDCKERVNAYFRNMHKYEKDIDIHVRFLAKIFKAFTDPNYEMDEKEWVLDKLLADAKDESDETYKILDLCYCYKMNKIIGNKTEVPVIRANDTIQGSLCAKAHFPERVAELLREKRGDFTFKFAESIEPDEEILELYNVAIARDHFFYYTMKN